MRTSMVGRTSWRAWLLWGLDMVVVVLAVVVLILIGSVPAVAAFGFPGFVALLGGVYAAVGVILAARRPDNPIGWVFLASGFCAGLQELATGYVLLAQSEPNRALLGVAYAAWLLNWIWVPYFLGTFIYLLLAFPDGRFVGSRGRGIAALAVVGMLVAFVGESLGTSALEVFPDIENPLHLLRNEAIAGALAALGFGLLALAGVLAVGSLASRWLVATGVERQQYRWLLAAGTVTGVSFAIGAVSYVVSGEFDGLIPDFFGRAVEALLSLGLAAVPVAVGIAITRYGLYELDRLISRTLSYSIVVGVLVGVYAVSVMLLRSILPLQGDLAVAGSTMAAAALVNPIRHRVQDVVDRRFNRSRYDAQRELERFAIRLRDHRDIDELIVDLTTFASTTMQPSAVHVWSMPRDASLSP